MGWHICENGYIMPGMKVQRVYFDAVNLELGYKPLV